MERSARKPNYYSSPSINIPSSAFTTPPATTPFRRRRLFVLAAVIVSCVLYFGVRWELPASLKEVDIHGPLTRANVVKIAQQQQQPAVPPEAVDEIYGLLYLVTRNPERLLGADTTRPVSMSVYAGEDNVEWTRFVEDVNKEFPLVVFSKTYCPYSKATKVLLKSYDLTPPPLIIEVDLRDDADLIKSALVRLTKHRTFPNILLRGKTLGGNDDMHVADRDGFLKAWIAAAGIKVPNWQPEE